MFVSFFALVVACSGFRGDSRYGCVDIDEVRWCCS
jgi:hypothetical protein